MRRTLATAILTGLALLGGTGAAQASSVANNSDNPDLGQRHAEGYQLDPFDPDFGDELTEIFLLDPDFEEELLEPFEPDESDEDETEDETEDEN